MAENETPESNSPTPSDDAAGYAGACMARAIHPPRAQDGVEALNNVRDAIVWLAAETRAARIQQDTLPGRLEEALGRAGEQIAQSVWEALRK